MFPSNMWYVIAWGSEVSDKPFHRIFCNESVLLFRSTAGEVAALTNICPHRFAPLHLGQIIDGDRIQCPYHGLEFDVSGRCRHNPHGPTPPTVFLKSFPVVERHSLVWLWLGEPHAADASLIPDFSCLTDPSLRTVGGVLKIEANFELVTDNLMDLSHVEFLHRGGLGSDAIKRGKHQVLQSGTTLFSNRWCPNDMAPPVWDALFGNYGKPVDHWLDMRWDPPAHMLLDVGVTPAGRPRSEGITTWGLDILTPETELSTHYFWGSTRNFEQDSTATDQMMIHAVDTAFGGQDKPMLEAVQRNMGARSFDDMRPLLLPFDSGAVRARRLLTDLRNGKRLLERPVAAP